MDKKQDSLLIKEQEKYTKVWEIEGYGETSPSEQLGMHIMLASPYFKIPPSSTDFRKTITDYGSGCGRTSLRLKEAGYTVRMVDIANNSYCPEVKEALYKETGKIPLRKIMFYQRSLWNLKGIPKSNYGICCDVMEHIPTEKIEDVLNQISCFSNSYVFFQISCVPDTFSSKYNDIKKLHLTVRKPKWWEKKLSKYFDIIESYEMFNKLYIAICKVK